MAVFKVDEYYPYYREVFNGNDIMDFGVYGQGNDKVGPVKNIMVDEDGHFRYFVVDTGFWIFGKQVLLPMAMARVDFVNKRVDAEGLTKQQVKDLPEFTEDLAINADYEERVRGIYRPAIATPTPGFIFDTTTYNYLQEPYFYDLNEPDIKTYEKRLRDRKSRTRHTISLPLGV